MRVITGLEKFLEKEKTKYNGKRIGLIANYASVNSYFQESKNLFYKDSSIHLVKLFSPQHGFRGEKQDNMIVSESYQDGETGLPVYTIYGKKRYIETRLLEDVDALVCDLVDVGTRVYTFIYTMALAMHACRRAHKKIIILDRPNPLNGITLEGNSTEKCFSSFVGMYPIPMRHGMTIGEIAQLFNDEFKINCDLDVITMEHWEREMFFDQTDIPWVYPSPNMPMLDTTIVYPGTVLFEGTNISEGRGTARPFEIIGAPYIDSAKLLENLATYNLKGCKLRPHSFCPTFNKYKDELCHGLQIHVTDRNVFQPLVTAIAIIYEIHKLWPKEFRWKEPPYEYITTKNPFDVINGTDRIRIVIESRGSLDAVIAYFRREEDTFKKVRQHYLIY